MKTTLHKSNTRGQADYGWLHANYSFSFGNYHDPSRVHFGLLRVLNDDIVDPGMGFDLHPHDNMEIVTIPLKGALEHRDNKGGHGIINAGDVQIMSAGTGIYHSEFNHSKTEAVNLFQVWIFPKVKNIQPRYDQKSFDWLSQKNGFKTVVSPNENDDTLWINQNAVFSIGNIDKGISHSYKINFPGNGVYLMVVEGKVNVGDITLDQRDALGIEDVTEFTITATEDSRLVAIEIPMK